MCRPYGLADDFGGVGFGDNHLGTVLILRDRLEFGVNNRLLVGGERQLKAVGGCTDNGDLDGIAVVLFVDEMHDELLHLSRAGTAQLQSADAVRVGILSGTAQLVQHFQGPGQNAGLEGNLFFGQIAANKGAAVVADLQLSGGVLQGSAALNIADAVLFGLNNLGLGDLAVETHDIQLAAAQYDLVSHVLITPSLEYKSRECGDSSAALRRTGCRRHSGKRYEFRRPAVRRQESAEVP